MSHLASPAAKTRPAGLSLAGVMAIGAAIITLQAVILYAIGQPAICTCGIVRLWTGDVSGGENSQQIADWYSLTHVMHGFIFYLLLWRIAPNMPFGLRLCIAVGIEGAWELVENSPMIIERYRQTAIAQGYFGDTVINSVSDNVAMIIGFLAARFLPVWASALYLIGAEILLAFVIRDNLTLNIINLIWPGALAF